MTMQPNESGPEKPDSFASLTASWQSDDFARWLLRGIQSWYDDSISFARREEAFYPALLDSDQNALPLNLQIEANLARLTSDSKAVFRYGLLSAFDGWAADMPQRVLQILLDLAIVYKPIGLPPILYTILVTGRLGWAERDETTRMQIFETMCCYATPNASQLLQMVRRSPSWRSNYAASYLLAQIASEPGSGWVEKMVGLRDDFAALIESGKIDMALLVRLVANEIGGNYNFIKDLPKLSFFEDEWLIEVLFKKSGAIIELDDCYGDMLISISGERLWARQVFEDGLSRRSFREWAARVLQRRLRIEPYETVAVGYEKLTQSIANFFDICIAFPSGAFQDDRLSGGDVVARHDLS